MVMSMCHNCPDNITKEEAYQGSLYCSVTIQANKCKKFPWGGEPKMVVEIIYISRYKGEAYDHRITIDNAVDYAYFKAIFDTLIEQGYDFKLRFPKEGEQQ